MRDLDSRSPRRREAARELLAQRVPEAARDWLRSAIASDDRTQLRMLGAGVTPAVLCARALAAARVASLPGPEPAPPPEPDVEVEAGPGPGSRK
ncbi:hypothetical protein [Neorhizobium sp. P12A]|uniref:hypothetical protein n=1 Tax=Neorhizobium sp. P12A TaxID=2268027 RepID=UPI0011EF425C|nr:hypothetical protein [Neorhizobium sp. P12A]